ncbi:DUF6044 family protein [Sulfuricurvum sp.]|uniref:DUF6044 family protein n=1 Tax=Sulfuricurvum sp. TaxID=2025608 RepID=UPI003C49D103
MIHLSNRNALWFFISISALFLYLLPLVVYGENNYIRVHDNLDITVPSLKILAQSGMIFSNSMEIVPNMMGGLPRLVYGSEFNYLLWLFVFFKPFTAMFINEIFIHFVAYFSMVALLQTILRDQDVEFKNAIIHLSSLWFALTPFFPATGLGVALLPYALFLLLKMRSRQDRWFDRTALLIIPFFSSFVLIYLFFLFCIGVFFIGEMLMNKKINTKLLLGLFGMIIVFLFIEYRLIYEMFIGDDFISHRSEFVRKSVDFMGAYRGAHNAFLFGQSHSINLQFFYVLAMLHLAIVISWLKNRLSVTISLLIVLLFMVSLFSGLWESILMSQYYLPILFLITLISLTYQKHFRLFYAFLLLVVCCSAWYGFWYYQGWIEFSQSIALLKTFDFSRFILLTSPIWYLLFALAGIIILKKIHFGMVIVAIISLLQLNQTFESAQFFPNPKGMTYQKFYDTALFDEIKNFIAKEPSSYKVASVGIHPAVPLYNGFYTLDGYAANYPLSYKHQFKQLVEKNFLFNPNAYTFIENWGSKCYLIAGEYSYDEYQRGSVIENFHFNAELFYAMGGRYILSGYKINNAAENHLQFQKVFTSSKSYWSIYLYRVDL